jgi:hypothetical protein
LESYVRNVLVIKGVKYIPREVPEIVREFWEDLVTPVSVHTL